MAISAKKKATMKKWIAVGGDDYVGNVGQILYSDYSERVVREWLKNNKGAYFTTVREETDAERDERIKNEKAQRNG